MSETDFSKRGVLLRSAVVFQLKLMADGFRDLVLMPVSLIATLVGFLRGGDEPDREFRQVIQLGRDSEKWINLFGTHDVPEDATAAASIDALFTKVETTVVQQYKAGGISESAQALIGEALKSAQEKVAQQQSGKKTDKH